MSAQASDIARSGRGAERPSRHQQPPLPLQWRTPGISAVADHPVPNRSSALDRWVGRVCAGVAEIAVGDRAAHQMVRIASPAVLARLQRQSRSGNGRRNSPIVRVLSVRVSRPAADTLEACAVVQGSQRCQAVAVQLRRRRSGWVLTAAEIR